MRGTFFNHIEIARQSIKANRMRSTLTMLGITIGVASITAILTLSGGATKLVQSQVDALGGTIAVVRPGAPSTHTSATDMLTPQQYAASPLTKADITTIEAIPNIAAIAPLMVLQGSIAGDQKAPTGTAIVATTPELEDVSELKLRDGQFLDPSLIATTAVIGPQLSIELYGTEHSIGKTITLKGKPFTIVGVLARENNPVNYNSVDFDNAVFVSLESGQELNDGSLHLQQINVQSDSVANLSAVITTINKELLKNHLGEVDFSVLSGAEISQPTSKLFSAVAGVSVAIAAISLIVGGVGIMNIMLVSVSERTREIGIRKALGASNGEVIAQFMIEALFLSVGGGVAGYLLGYALAFGVSMVLTFNPLFTWNIAAISLGLSLIVGIVFGIYPALRAAKKDPITALRQYE